MFVTVFPGTMNSQMFRLQPEGVLREQLVPPLLLTYNKYMGAVDLNDQLIRTYGLIGNPSVAGFGHSFFVLK